MAFELKPEKNDMALSGNESAHQNSVLWAHTDTTPPSSQKFYAVSTMVHVGMLIATAFISAPLIPPMDKETVTIEIESEPEQARGAFVPETKGGSPSNIPVAQIASAPVKGGNELPGDDEIVVSKPSGKASVAKASVAKASTMKAEPAPKAAPIQAMAASIDDIDAPELDEAKVEHTKVVRGFDDDLGSDFSEVDNHHKAKVAALANELQENADSVAKDQDEFLNSIAEETEKNTSALLAQNRARRAQDYNEIAAASAAEKAAAARAAALAEARTKASGRNGTGSAPNGGGSGRSTGDGAGQVGANTASTMLAGSPNGVRSLEQLRQMPGNPIPQYSQTERMQGHQGNVVFHAYIERNGSVSRFKQLSSTGYANLDTKTLDALRKWKFYPGQEGWVELPFGWTLKGGAKAVGGTLRTRSAMR